MQLEHAHEASRVFLTCINKQRVVGTWCIDAALIELPGFGVSNGSRKAAVGQLTATVVGPNSE
jgi:hypothetical protein